MSWLVTPHGSSAAHWDHLSPVGIHPDDRRLLLFKATSELHERLEAKPEEQGGTARLALAWVVIAQILVLDAVFPESIITAVGMVDHLGVAMAAVTIAMVVMVLASKPPDPLRQRPPHCGGALPELPLDDRLQPGGGGLGYHIPKGYLYAAIGFSVLIEFFNQLAQRSALRHEARQPPRERTTAAIFKLMGNKRPPTRRRTKKRCRPSPRPWFPGEGSVTW